MATRNLTVTLSEETIRLMDAAIATSEYFDYADVVQAAVERLCTTEEDFDDWIRREAIPVLEALEADPSTGLTAEEVLTSLKEDREDQLRKAS